MSYKNGKLIKEEQYHSIDGSIEKQRKTTYKYYYNKQGLIIKVEKLNGKKFSLDRKYYYHKR